MIIPQPLCQGDKVAIISPASHIKGEYIDGAVHELEAKGFIPVVCPHARGINGSYSGTPDERLADLKGALEDDSVKAILCARGGYGTVHLIDSLSPEYIRSHAKWIIGYSDISALHSTFVTAGVCSVHAPMCNHLAIFGGNDFCSTSLFNILSGKKPEYSEPAHPYNVQGEAVGQIVGGNMAVMCALIGSDKSFIKPGTILFIEDVDESVYRIERMMYQLQLSGVLSNLKGLIVGQFTNCNQDDENNEDMNDMIHRMVANYKFPIAFNFPIGHVDENIPIIEGANVSLKVNDKSAVLTFIG